MRLTMAALVSGVGATTLHSHASSPLSQVVKMLETTLKDLKDERTLKEKAYEKTSCLAKKTTEKNDQVIEESQNIIDESNNELSLLGSVTLTDEGRVLTGKIDAKKKEITGLVQELDSMTQAHTAHMTDLDAGIAALMDAEKQIQGKTFLVQKAAITRVLSSRSAKLSPTQQDQVNTFLKQAPAEYKSQVGAITELIVNLKQQYQKEGVVAKREFGKNEKAQNALIDEANMALSTLQQEFEAGEGEAGAKQKRSDELNEAIGAATKAIADAKASTKEMADMAEDHSKNWKIFLDDSNAQEEAINKAIEILSDDDARSQFQTVEDNTKISVFLQTEAASLMTAEGSAAIQTLRDAIKDMKGELEEEKDNIIASVDKCEKDTLNLLENAKQAAEQMDGFTANINALQRKIESEQEKQKHFTEEIADRMAERAEAIKIFDEKIKDLNKIHQDLMDANAIVKDAIAALNDYSYQAGGKSTYHEETKTNPLAGVISLLENIKSDFSSKMKHRQTEISKETSDHNKYLKKVGHESKLEDPEDQFVSEINSPDSLIGDLEAERNASITAENDAQTSLNADSVSLGNEKKKLYGNDGKSGLVGAFNQMQPGCDYWMVNAPGRKSEIADEIAALLSADTILANQDLGMAPEDAATLEAREKGADRKLHEQDFVATAK